MKNATKLLGIDYDTVQKKLALVEESNKKAATNLANAMVPVTMFDANGNMIGTTFKGSTMYIDSLNVDSLDGISASKIDPSTDFGKYYSSLGLPEEKTVINNTLYINNVDTTTPYSAALGADNESLFLKMQKLVDSKFGSNSVNPNSTD